MEPYFVMPAYLDRRTTVLGSCIVYSYTVKLLSFRCSLHWITWPISLTALEVGFAAWKTCPL